MRMIDAENRVETLLKINDRYYIIITKIIDKDGNAETTKITKELFEYLYKIKSGK